MRFKECIIAWDDDTGEIKVGPWPPETNLTRHLPCSIGAPFYDKMGARQQALKVFVEFACLAVKSGLTVDALHKAFLSIDEYRWLIAEDMKGSKEGPDWFYEMLKDTDESGLKMYSGKQSGNESGNG